eukprot:SAG22_NODE_763_length_7406_cov_22.129054_9_plen_129_part_01
MFQNCHDFNHASPHGMYYMSMSAALSAYAKQELATAKERLADQVKLPGGGGGGGGGQKGRKRKARRSFHPGVSLQEVWEAVRHSTAAPPVAVAAAAAGGGAAAESAAAASGGGGGGGGGDAGRPLSELF